METIDEIQEIKALKKEIKALKEAYAEMTIEKKVYETYLQVYGEETGRSEEIKKARTRTIQILSEKKQVSIKAACKVFKITGQDHYKAVKALEKEGLSEELILDWVKEKRKVNKSEGGRKLFCRFDNELKGITKIGRDKFFKTFYCQSIDNRGML